MNTKTLYTTQEFKNWHNKVAKLVHSERPECNISIDANIKYIKVVCEYLGQRSAFCFVDTEGNIYKSASWNKPAKGIRGNIYTDNLGVDAYGGLYR